ncbi:MAG: glycerol-3-phosphate dehydrogenase/oxidase [Saprospiraceae bacterium]|nr:glycerol-3-phosphate dehydrogenase/oxidase [Pyrinomonadaceae bacterium]
MDRYEILNRIKTHEEPWDIVIIGGGATGIGCAVDAAARGFDVLLLEQHDFGKGTSSRSTKLVHGGVRYLAQGNIKLVREALKERGILYRNAPHLVKKTAFIVPCYSLWQKVFYGTGLKIYDLLSGKYSFGKSRLLAATETIERLPSIKTKGLRGGVLYFDGQFDDSRLLINLATTAQEQGADVLNYAKVDSLIKGQAGQIAGVVFEDLESSEKLTVKAKVIINATGAFSDSIRKLSDAGAENIITFSQGIHLVFDRKFLSRDCVLMIPKTSDGRVLFAIPWHGHLVVGTTDTPTDKAELEPKALDAEIDLILETAGNYLSEIPKRSDILSIFVGIRPLIRSERTKKTSTLSREHLIEIDEAGLLTITGGKWTTYRKMAEDTIDRAIIQADLPSRKSATADLKIHGYSENLSSEDLAIYGSDADGIQALIDERPELKKKLHKDLPYCEAEIVWSVTNEMAQTAEDVLARRTRVLFLNAQAAIDIAPRVAEIVAKELGRDSEWIAAQVADFNEVAQNYKLF